MEAEAGPGATEAYPVDILEDDPASYQAATQGYYEFLQQGTQASAEVLSLPTGEQVRLQTSSLRFYPMYRDERQHKLLVLVNPQDTKTVVAVYLKGSWWSTEDVLRTSDSTRDGLRKVQSFGERIVLFVLNTIVFGRLERNLDDDDMFFLPHPAKEQAKILWRDGAAVGFYSIKKKVLRQFLLTCPGERGRLWEVEPPGSWDQRDNIWLKVYLHETRLQDGTTVHPESSEDGTNTPRQPFQGVGPTQFDHGEIRKEWITGGQETQNDQECVKREEDSGMFLRPSWDETEDRGAKRTVAVTGLVGEPWQKHVREAPNSSEVHLVSPASEPEGFMWSC
ncbi:protein FAM169B isoform X2 [Phodopus roborovskii]|uniref:protein FAM169B isoform X2 n=1 Tax=Phodopus roborovskii TaxID=109678 RepID=UPI0021E46ECD|nr:protein FAM169B isoform X2 [Phodopus roborovskii]